MDIAHKVSQGSGERFHASPVEHQHFIDEDEAGEKRDTAGSVVGRDVARCPLVGEMLPRRMEA